eukprot:UN03218
MLLNQQQLIISIFIVPVIFIFYHIAIGTLFLLFLYPAKIILFNCNIYR